MTRMWVTLVSVLVTLATVGWWFATRSDRANPGDAAADVQPQPEKDPEPDRPPELFGTVEAVGDLGEHGKRFLVRSTKPNKPGWDSEQNVHHRNIDMPCWVMVSKATSIRNRAGGATDVKVGQTVSVWCSGRMLTSNPPGWGGDFVVIEPADR